MPPIAALVLWMLLSAGYAAPHMDFCYPRYAIWKQDMCLSVRAVGNASDYCLPVLDGWVDIPLPLSGVQRIVFEPEEMERIFFIYTKSDLPVSDAWSVFTYPSFGTVTTTRLKLNFRSNPPMRKHGVNLVGIREMNFPSTFTDLDSVGHQTIEPGSYFIQIYPADNPYLTSHALTNHGYIEFVLPPAEIAQNRRFHTPTETRSSGTNIYELDVGKKKRVCIWGSDVMDGQKSIWLQQMKHMDQDQFEFTYLLSRGDPPGDDEEVVIAEIMGTQVTLRAGGMTLKVHQLGNVRISMNPFDGLPLNVDNFKEMPSDGGKPLSEVWDGTEVGCAAYVIERLDAAEGNIMNVSPTWCKDFLNTAVLKLHDENCDLIAYGNNRGHTSDLLLVSLAKRMRIPIVGELLNLFVSEKVVPDVLVAPSHYAAEHPSVLEALEANNRYADPRYPPVVVISPGISPKQLIRPTVDHLIIRFHQQPAFVIGYMGRLAIEKNVALFILAAHALLQKCPFCRFVIIGNGELTPYLEDLCERLQIRWAVHFTGWISSDVMPRVWPGIDVLVNPSLRAWSETFCIVNIEAMGMKVPLVTFGVGGIGEYVVDPGVEIVHDQDTNDIPLYSIGSNAIIVNVATPQAIAAAVHLLMEDSELRSRIGIAGYNTVRSYFTTSRQMKEYENLYHRLTRD